MNPDLPRVTDLELRHLGRMEASLYVHMTYPAYRSLLWPYLAGPGVVAIGAACAGRMVGLGLALIVSPPDEARILSIYVVQEERGHGVGYALFERLEKELRGRGCRSASVVFKDGGSSASALRALLAHRRWSPPRARTLICKADGRFLAAPWFHKCKLPEEYSIFPWTELTPAERCSLYERQGVQRWIPDDLLPERHEPGMAALNSVGLRLHHEVVGWVITQRIGPQLYRYSCSFVRDDLQRSLRIVPLYQEAIRRQAREHGISSVGIWTVPARHVAMARFARRRMRPYLLSLDESMESCKDFASS